MIATSDPQRIFKRFAALLADRRALVFLVALDLLSKWLAFAALPEGVDLREESFLQFVLVVNHSGRGSWFAAMPSDQIRSLGHVGIALLLTSGVVLLTSRTRPAWRRILACAATYALVVLLAWRAWPNGLPGLSSFGSVLLLRGGQASFFSMCWWSSTTKPWRLTLLFFAGAAVGNFLSLCVPPFGVIDFVYSSVMNWALGFWIFNLADLYYAIALLLIAVFTITWFFRRLRWGSR